MRLGYNTNGLAHHRLTDAIDLIAAEGFQSVAITLDVGRARSLRGARRSSPASLPRFALAWTDGD